MHEPVGIGGVVAALSVTSDLTRGHPMGEAMRACLLATELARRAGLDASDQRRPDGRSFDNPQVVLFTVDGDRVRTVDQFVGARVP